MATKHTPGPWITKLYEPDKDGIRQWGVRQSPDAPSVSVGGEALSCGFSICNIVAQDMEDVENGEECANARLIAAAPKLLEALKTSIQSGPMRIEPTPTVFKLEIEKLPDNTMIDFRVSVATYKEIIAAIAEVEGKD